MTTAIETETHVGKIIQVIGPVLDVEFESDHLPELYNALRVEGTTESGTPIKVTVEVQQHIGRNQVRAVAMSTTDGVERGMDVIDTGSPITVPVGAAALGRILNVIGEPVDNGAPIALTRSAGRFTAHHRTSRISKPRPKFSKPASKSSISSRRL